jgi:hypothetical protein
MRALPIIKIAPVNGQWAWLTSFGMVAFESGTEAAALDAFTAGLVSLEKLVAAIEGRKE